MPLITPTAYFPPANWFAAAVRAGEWRIEAHENYQRKGWRNRARIAGPNGVQFLSVPLAKGKNQRMPIRDVRIANDENWRREHVAAIKSAYGRAPFYEYYADPILSAIDHSGKDLFQLNNTLISNLIRALNLSIELRETTDFMAPQTLSILPALAPYPQVFTDRQGFRSELSILDAVFCLGPSFATHAMTLGADAGAENGPDKASPQTQDHLLTNDRP